MKRICAILFLAALLCGCGRGGEMPAETLAEPTAETVPVTTETPQTTAVPPSPDTPTGGTIAFSALSALTEQNTLFLYDYHPLSNSGWLYVWQPDGVICRYLALDLDWIYGEGEPKLELLDTVQVGRYQQESTKKRLLPSAPYHSTELMITGNRLLGFSRDDKADQPFPASNWPRENAASSVSAGRTAMSCTAARCPG